jgi:hypothetical protein
MAKAQRGGARPGSGRKKGSLNPSTITKEAAREALRQIVLREMGSLVSAQMAQAKGLSYMVVRDKASGKFLRVAEDQAAKLNPEEQVIEIWEKDPSVQAFTDLMNRALDKPKEQEQDVNANVSLSIKWATE